MEHMRLARPEMLVDIGRVGELAEPRLDERAWPRVGAAVRQAEAQHGAAVSRPPSLPDPPAHSLTTDPGGAKPSGTDR